MKLGKFTVTFDFDKTIAEGTDRFGLTVLQQSWGWNIFSTKHSYFIGYKRPNKQYLRERKDCTRLRDHFDDRNYEIKQGKKKDPLLMDDRERRESSREFARTLVFSKDFSYRVTTPLALQCIERGNAFDPMSGIRFNSLNEMEAARLLPKGSASMMAEWDTQKFIQWRDECRQKYFQQIDEMFGAESANWMSTIGRETEL